MSEQRGHLLLFASAGTGKTYRLVKTYVEQVIEHGVRPSRIVAITFTKKAAAELRARIRDELKREANGAALSRDLMRAPIGNFHGLALQIMQSFGFSAGFPDAPLILGEQGEDERLFVEACEDAWFARGTEAAAALARVAPLLKPSPKLMAALWRGMSLAREDGAGDGLLERFVRYDPEATRRRLHAQCVTLHDGVAAALASGAFDKKGNKTREKLEACRKAPRPPAGAPFADWADVWASTFGHLKRAIGIDEWVSKALLEEVRDGFGAPVAEQACAALVPDLQVLMRSALAVYEDKKRSLRAMDFTEVIERLVGALETRPELHHAIRERYDAVLVDEAQDTNRLQRRLVHLLAGLDGPARDRPPARLFVVGDRKQAIYTFRGADPAAFEDFARDVKGLGGTEETLETSWRSTPGVIAGVNHLGRSLFDPYEALVARQIGGAPPAFTWHVPHVASAAPGESPSKVERVLAETRATAAIVAAALEGGKAPGEFAVILRAMTKAPAYLQAFAERGIPAVLGGGGGLYEQQEILDFVALLQWLCDPEATLSAAVALRSPFVALSDAGLFLLLGEQGKRGLTALRRGQLALDVFADAHDRRAIARLNRLLPELTSAGGSLGAGAFVREVERAFEVRAVLLAQPFGEQRLANVERLVELAFAHESTTGLGAGHFARQQADTVARAQSEPLRPVAAAAHRAVSILTVHQAKGLEYDHVILPDLWHQSSGEGTPFRYVRGGGFVVRPIVDGEKATTQAFAEAQRRAAEEEQRELQRLLYVAVTRARAAVTFVAAEPLDKRGFARLLDKWRDQAVAEGLMRVEREEAPPPVAVSAAPAAPSAPAPVAPSKRRRASTSQLDLFSRPSIDHRVGKAPDGTRFVFSVSELERLLSAPAPSAPRWRPQPSDDRDPPLDPLARGRLAHLVLANLHRRARAASLEAFIDAELANAGYDPEDPRTSDVRGDLRAFFASPVGRAIAAVDQRLRRHEMPFQLRLEVAPWSVVIHGQLDLLLLDGAVPTIVDFKHARAPRGASDAYAVQLDAYALAVERLCHVDTPITTRLVYLRDGGVTVERTVTPEMRRDLAERISALVRAVALPGTSLDTPQ